MTNKATESVRERKTILSVDLVGYNIVAESAEEGLGVDVVKILNLQIQQFINSALEALKLSRQDHFVSDTGDGGILLFDTSDDALLFATHVIKQTEEYNRERHKGSSKRIFRIGAATGEIVIARSATGGFEIAGTTISRAVRLEAKAPPGGLLVDKLTFDTLKSENRKEFGSSRAVAGKRDETYDAYLREPYPNAENDASFFRQEAEALQETTQGVSEWRIERSRLLRDMNQLHPHTYFPMIFLLEIPIDQRPSNELNLLTKRHEVVRWAEDNGKLPELLQVIRELSGPQRPR
jgi:class 3 adenylate cyclase